MPSSVLRVVHVITGLGVGGAEMTLFKLLQAAGHLAQPSKEDSSDTTETAEDSRTG